MTIEASNFKSCPKNTLVGFVTLTLPSGLIIHNVTIHRKGEVRWIGLPAREYIKDGAKGWAPLIEFVNTETRKKFQEAAFAAIDRLLVGVGDVH